MSLGKGKRQSWLKEYEAWDIGQPRRMCGIWAHVYSKPALASQ